MVDKNLMNKYSIVNTYCIYNMTRAEKLKSGLQKKNTKGSISKYLKCSLLISTVKGKNLIKKVKVQFQQTTELEYKNVGQAVSWEKK